MIKRVVRFFTLQNSRIWDTMWYTMWNCTIFYTKIKFSIIYMLKYTTIRFCNIVQCKCIQILISYVLYLITNGKIFWYTNISLNKLKNKTYFDSYNN